MAIEQSLRVVPRLSDAPDRFESVLLDLSALRDRLKSAPAQEPETIARIDALAEAVERTAADAAALTRRLSAIVQTAAQIFQSMDFTFLFDDTRKLFSIGYRVADGSSGSELL